jgi:hypothetical protein
MQLDYVEHMYVIKKQGLIFTLFIWIKKAILIYVISIASLFKSILNK